MAGKGRGGGKTPARVTGLLQEAVGASSIRAVARESGLTQSAVYRYLQGIGEPSLATLERLSVYFGVSVAELRGERDKRKWRVLPGCYEGAVEFYFNMLQDSVEVYGIIPDRLKPATQILVNLMSDETRGLIEDLVERQDKEAFETEGLKLEYLPDFREVLCKAQDILDPPEKSKSYQDDRNRIDALLSQVEHILLSGQNNPED